jgi:hypothetical protein
MNYGCSMGGWMAGGMGLAALLLLTLLLLGVAALIKYLFVTPPLR